MELTTYKMVPAHQPLFHCRAGIGAFFFFCKGPDSKYFRLREPYDLCLNYPTLLLQGESSHGQCITRWHGCVPVKLHKNRHLSGFGPQARCRVSPPAGQGPAEELLSIMATDKRL